MKGAAVSAYRDAIDHLPPGGMLVVQGVTWGEYEHLLEELSDRPGVRIAFDHGRLQAVSPLRAHEHYGQVLQDAADAAADVLNLPLEPLGSTTLRQVAQLRGVEPDKCFYIANAHRIAGRTSLDLDRDPPPDIVVEIDLSSDSRAKLPIYAALGVPEIWLYDGRKLNILELQGGSYSPIDASRFLPLLTAALLDRQLEASKTTSRTELRRAIRKWLGEAG